MLVQYVAEALVDFASLTSLDTLFDLGCNDGMGPVPSLLLHQNSHAVSCAQAGSL